MADHPSEPATEAVPSLAPSATGAALRVKPDDLNVAPAVLGLPLATPARRLAAMGIDLLVVAVVSSLGNLWLLAAGGVLLAERARARRTGPSLTRRGAAWLLAALLAGMAIHDARQAQVSGATPADAAEAAEPDDVDAAQLAALKAQVQALQAELAAARAGAAAAAPAASMTKAPAGAPSAPSTMAPPATAPPRLRDRVTRGLDELGIGYGWAIVYFSLLPVWWRGQTVGKRLLRLRVLELTGKPMTPMRCLRRYGGYVAGMATGGLGLAQVLWDSNRQGLQDKAAHTVVVDEREPSPAVRLPP